jgi:hypothetical protein
MKRFVMMVAAILTVGWLACGNDSSGGGGGNGPPQNKAWVRFGNLSVDAPPTDLCVKTSGTQDWGSPVLGKNGVDAGLAFPAMSKVIYIDPGTLDFRAVAPGGDCSTPLGPDLTAQTINAHGTYTITAVGQLAPGSAGPYQVIQYIDHQEAPAAGKARFRFTNVVANSAPLADGVSGNLADGGTWTWLTEAEMPFRWNAAGTGIVDGYQDIDPNPALPITLRLAPPQQNPDLFTAPVNFKAGVITGVWAIGLFGGTGDQRVGYLMCDEVPAAQGGQTNCSRSP